MYIDGEISFKYLTCVNNVGIYWVNRLVEKYTYKKVYQKAVARILRVSHKKKIVGGQLLAHDHCLHMQSIYLVHWKPRAEKSRGKLQLLYEFYDL